MFTAFDVVLKFVKVTLVLLLLSGVSVWLAHNTPLDAFKVAWFQNIQHLTAVYYAALLSVYLDLPEKK